MLDCYIPTVLLQQLAETSPKQIEASARHRRGAAMFVDISGFTLLTQTLGQRGPIGAELVGDLLNEYFGQFVTIIAAHCGEVVEFTGDAILACWFTGEDTLHAATCRAAECALSIQKFLQRRSSALDTRLKAHIGVGAGEMVTSIVGGLMERWHFFAAGDAINQAAIAMADAAVDTVAVSGPALALLGSGCRIERRGDCARLLCLSQAAALPPIGKALRPRIAMHLRNAFISPEVLARVHAGHSDWLAEFRRVTVVFVNIGELNFGSKDSTRTQQAVQAMQSQVARFEGSDIHLVCDDKDTTFVAAWGGPLSTHEDDSTRGVLAAMAINETLLRLEIENSIGVSTGRLFCGTVGAELRRAYTMNGSSINLAARLMREAGGGVLCDTETAIASDALMRFQRIASVQLKGITQPVPIYRPSGRVQSPVKFQSKLIGREAEIERFRSMVCALVEHRDGGSILVSGDPGIGKSRLLDRMQEVATEQEVVCLRCEGSAIENAVSYYAWRAVLDQLFRSYKLDQRAQIQTAVVNALSSDPGLAAKAALLNNLIALDIPETPEIRRMESAGRADATLELIIALLMDASGKQPLVLILDDAHWFDSGSWSVIAAAARRLPRILLLVATRAVPESMPPGFQQLQRVRGLEHMALLPLPRTGALELVALRLGVRALPHELAAFIHQKAEGNPFFSEQLALSLLETGHLTIENGHCHLLKTLEELRRLSVPDNVQGVILGRIDRLKPPQQLTLKIASVFGRTFNFRALADVYPIARDRPALERHLNYLTELDLTVLHSDDPEEAYQFKHAITQEVAYNLMAFVQRRQLHRSIAQWYERMHAADVDRYLPLLAHHWTRSADTGKAFDYLERATEQALLSHAHSEVARFMSDALGLDEQNGQRASRERRSNWEFRLAEALLKLSRYGDSLGNFTKSLLLVDRALPARNRLLASLAFQLLMQLLHRIGRWPFGSDSSNAKPLLLQAAHAHQRIAEIGYWNHDFGTLLHSTLCSLNVAEKAGPSKELQLAYHVMGFTCGLSGLHFLFRSYTRRADRLGERILHLETTGFCAQLNTIYFNCNGRWSDVHEAGSRGQKIFEQIGDRFRLQSCVILRAYACLHQGDLMAARRLFEDSYAIVGDDGSVQARVWSVAGLLAVDLAQFGSDQEDRSSQIELLLEEKVDHSDAIMCHGLLAIAHHRRGKHEAALSHAKQATQLIDKFPPASFHTLIATASVVEMYLLRWETSVTRPAEAIAPARRALDGLIRFARICPIGVPSSWRHRASFDWLSGHHERARRKWHRAAIEARKMSMRHEENLARLQLAGHLQHDDAEGISQLDRVITDFQSSGSCYYAQVAEQLVRQVE